MGYGKMCSAEDAPAFAGILMNENHPADQRLACGAQALNYYVDQADKLHELLAHLTTEMGKTEQDDYELMYALPVYQDVVNRLQHILDGRDREDTFGLVCINCESRRLKAGACTACGTIQIRRRA